MISYVTGNISLDSFLLMTYEIPSQLEYKEKIMFGLTFSQLAYALLFGVIVLIIFTKTNLDLTIKISLALLPSTLAILFMFFDAKQWLVNWKHFLAFRKINLMDRKMIKFFDIKKIEKNILYISDKKLAFIKVEPINFIIKNEREKETIITSFQQFLNSLDFPLQIMMGTETLNLDKYLDNLNNRVIAKYQKLFNSLKLFLSALIKDTAMIDRKFYIIIPEKENIAVQLNLVAEKLNNMGIKAKQLEDKEIEKLLTSLFPKDENDKKKYTQKPEPTKLEQWHLRKPKQEELTDKNKFHSEVAPLFIHNYPDYLQIGEKLNRVITATGYPRMVEPGFLDRIVTANGQFDISIHIEPKQLSTLIVDLNRELQKQRADLFIQESKGIINPSLEIQYQDTRAVLEQDRKGNERLFNVSLYINCHGKNKQELQLLTSKVKSELNSSMIVPTLPIFRMSHALKSVLPFSTNELSIKRNVTTSALSAFFPFTSQFLQVDKTGVWFGLNKNNIPIIKDIFSFTNPNGCILASSGSGKSYTAKLFIARQVLNGTKVIVIDPQSEYKELTKAFKGQLVTISKTSLTVINPLDLMGHDYDEKRLAMMDLLAVMLGGISEIQKATLDKALAACYRQKGITRESYDCEPPIIADLYNELEAMSKDATLIERDTYRSLMNRLGLYVDGAFSFLNRHTKIDFSNDFVCFNIGDMPKQVKPVIMFLILDYVYMKMKKDIERKLLVIDEAWSLLARAEEEGYIFEIVKTCRKFNLGLLLITQDVGDLLSSKAGNALLSNSSYTILLRQKPAIIDKVTETFHLSRNERDILLTAGKGEGLFIAENEHSEIKVKASDEEHKLITTNPDELLANKKEETKNTTLRKVSIKVD